MSQGEALDGQKGHEDRQRGDGVVYLGGMAHHGRRVVGKVHAETVQRGDPDAASVEKASPSSQGHREDRRRGDDVAKPLEGKLRITPTEEKSGQKSPRERPHLRKASTAKVQEQRGVFIIGIEVPEILEGPSAKKHGEERPSDHAPGLAVVHPVEPETPNAPEHRQRERQHPENIVRIEGYRTNLYENGEHGDPDSVSGACGGAGNATMRTCSRCPPGVWRHRSSA